MLRYFVCIGILVLILGGCSGQRINDLEKRTNSAISDIRGIQAEHTVAINSIRSELRAIQGKLEELDHVSRGKTQELEKSLAELGSRIPPPQGVPEDLLSRDDEKIARLSGPAADIFKQALRQLRTGDIEGARSSLIRFVEQNPGTAFTDNALFWLGICYTKLGEYDRAIVSFSDVFQSYPAEDMVAPALYFLAETFEKTGSKNDARMTYQKLVDEYPNSPYVLKARGKLIDSSSTKKSSLPSSSPSKKR